ncbi:hypothetical protein [Streptomyces sp. NPDC090083]|uniref:hypothetical protein n=1 Tax=Streptomyces sp. NPDC090083 TaxID=3365941 RepID=UPI00381EAB66
MKGFVLQGPGQFSWETVPDPGIKDATDVIVRVPHADLSVHLLLSTLEAKDAVLLADNFPTGYYEVGVLNGQIRPGDTVAVIGVGPVGPAAMATARLDAANWFGADVVVDTRDTEEAYDVFAKAADTGVLKVVLGGTRHEEVALPAAGREDVTRHA